MQRWIGAQFSKEIGNGAEMHDSISADRWCVTRRDLRRLRRDVLRAIKQGQVLPTELDPFDPGDKIYGPTIYTVNEQFIKPVTAEKGNMSWALMKHPAGLQCDLFVTHAWQEGIFEFVDKVLNSWPPWARRAWCCMLANPQNLDISHLIRTPISSPFACALQSAKYMLVVPNRRASIYTRLWCAYEAYLAYEWEKVIITASAPPTGRVFAVVIAILCALAGAVAGVFLGLRMAKFVFYAFGFTMYPLLLGSVLSTSAWRRVCNLVGAFWSAHCYSMLMCVSPQLLDFDRLHGDESWEAWRNMQVTNCMSLVVYFCVAELDRLRNLASDREAEMLRANFTGSISGADCTSAEDSANIRAEIGGLVPEVDATVHQLIRAGMSTQSLRAAAKAGVDVERFTCIGYSFAILVTGTSMPSSESLGVKFDPALFVMSLLSVVLTAVAMIAWRCMALDSRIFTTLVMQKVVLIVQRPPQLIIFALWQGGKVSTLLLLRSEHVLTVLTWALTLSLYMAGIDGVARIPRIGRGLAQFLVAKGRAGVRKAFEAFLEQPACSNKDKLEKSSPSEESSEEASEGEQSSESSDAADSLPEV